MKANDTQIYFSFGYTNALHADLTFVKNLIKRKVLRQLAKHVTSTLLMWSDRRYCKLYHYSCSLITVDTRDQMQDQFITHSVSVLLDQLLQLLLSSSNDLINNFSFLHQNECWHCLHLEFLRDPLFTFMHSF